MTDIEKLEGLKTSINKAKGTGKAQSAPRGYSGIRASGGMVSEEFIADLRWPKAGRIYQEMASNDAVVGGCLYLIETMLRKAKWIVTPAKLPDAENIDSSDQENATFVEQCLYDMNDTWDFVLSDILTMLRFGFSFHEIVYKVRRGPQEKQLQYRSKFTDGKIGWQGFFIRAQTSMDQWVFDDRGNVTAFSQNTDFGQAELTIDGNLLFKLGSEKGNPEGVSLLRRAYRSWYFKRHLEEIEAIGIERNLAGLPIIMPPDNLPIFDEKDPEMVAWLGWATNLVNNLRNDRNHGAIIPFGWELKLLSPEGSVIDVDKVIHRHDDRIAVTMLADVLLMGGDRTGSFALAEVKQDLLLSSLQTILNAICNTINNSAIPQLLALNGIIPANGYPKLEAKDLALPSVKDVALLLRSMKLDYSRSPEFFNFLMSLISAPNIDKETIDEMASAGNEGGNGQNPDGTTATDNGQGRTQDTAENDFKQSGAQAD